MPTDNWRSIERLYHEALARPAAERVAFLTDACDDDALRREVLSLLEQPAVSGFLGGQAVDVAAAMIDAGASQWTGRRIGVYELQTLLGKGGMGEVYRARDTRLGREVAIKVLPRAFTADAERLARFEREARHLAALNHPHIGALYGLEEGDGTRALVLELVEGETLEDRVVRGAMPISDALVIARQIADALEFAHEKGIVHRDLKPANIKITPEGTAKVLDFGLAKASVADSLPADPRYTPIVTGGATEEGIVLGTPAYMSPEQARGRAVDKRTDIWAFGCVLYAMLTGRLAFRGETASDMMAAVLEREPDWTALPAATPRAIDRLLRRCVEKDAKRRLRDIGEARFAIDEALSRPAGQEDVMVPAGQRGRKAVVPWAVALAAVVAAIVGFSPASTTAPPPWENPFADAVPRTLTNWPGTEADPAISGDGKVVAFVADPEGEFDVYFTRVDSGGIHNLTESPDDDDRPNCCAVSNVGFAGDGSDDVWLAGSPAWASTRRLQRVPLFGSPKRSDFRNFLDREIVNVAWSTGGTRTTYYRVAEGDPMYVADRNGDNPELIYKSEPGLHNHGLVWSPDAQWIYFAQGFPPGAMDVYRIRPTPGSQPEQLTRDRTVISLAPIDDRRIVYVSTAEDGSGPWLWVLDVQSRMSHRANMGPQRFMSVAASADGRRVVAATTEPRASLWTVPIPAPGTVATKSDPYQLPSMRALAPRVRDTSLFYLSSQGTGDGLWRFKDEQLGEIWHSSRGLLLEPPAISRDGQSVIVLLRERGKRILTLVTLDGGKSLRLDTRFDVGGTVDWSRDDAWIVFAGKDGVFKVPVGGGESVLLAPGPASFPIWSPKDDLIVYTAGNIGARAPLRAVRPDGTAVELGMVVTQFGVGQRFLPDGSGVVFADGSARAKDFWLFDLSTTEKRRLTQFTAKPDQGYIANFDITHDRKIVFDLTTENSNVVLFDLPRR